MGLKQETVIRSLSKLKEEKIIDIKGKEIIIRDPQILGKIAQGDSNSS